ncbi:MAG: ribose 5-phosphate isomerase B [Kiritimatiellaeota bacterium]|nr:ribose 5-phosphate isomerase B [Kiritimatiellota bacterium]
MTIAIGSDHGGFAIKEAAKKYLTSRAGIEIADKGCASAESCDYPDFAEKVAEAVDTGAACRGILVCTTGIGMSIAANRYPNVRAARCVNAEEAKIARSHNKANVITLSGKLAESEAAAIITAWLDTPFSGEERHARRVAKLTGAGNRVTEISHLRGADPDVHAAILAHKAQEEQTVNLIASENLTSRAVREAQGSILTNKYAEGYPGRRWYSGCKFVDDIETLAIERAKELFGAEAANVQPHCGSAANMAVFFAMLQPGDTILSMSLDQGGHLSHGSPVNFSGRLFNILSYTVDPKTELLDYDAIEEQARREKPKMIVAGASAYPRVLDFKRWRKIADACGAYLLVDMAHIAGLVAGGAHESPVPYAEFVTTTTHKTLRGPRSGLVLCKKEFEKAINSTVFPGLQGGPLMHTTAAKAVCFKEAMSQEFKDYAAQIVANSRRLAASLAAKGFRLVSGGTDNHLFLVDVAASGITGKDASAALDEAGIIVNKNTIPFDKASPFVTSGIRVGTASVTTRGMKEAEMDYIGAMMARVLENIADTESRTALRREITEFAARFPVP